MEEQLPSTPAEAREARRASETRRAAAAAVAAAVREGGGAEEEKAEGAEDDEDGDGDDDEDGEETDDDPSPPPPPAAGGTVPMTAEATVGVAGENETHSRIISVSVLDQKHGCGVCSSVVVVVVSFVVPCTFSYFLSV